MKKQITHVTFGFVLACLCFANPVQAHEIPTEPMLLDSIGIERVNNKLFVKHKVTAGQTLYAIARRYNTTLDAIKAANPTMADGVRTDQILRIPYTGESVAGQQTKAPEPVQPKAVAKTQTPEPLKKTGIHTVEPLETLYMVATIHKVLMADIRRWNKLTTDQLEPGQRLIVTEKAYKASLAAAVKPQPEAPKLETAPTPAPVASMPTKPEPAKAESKPEPVKIEPVRTEPVHTSASKTEITKADINSPTALKAESTRVERTPIPPAESTRPVTEDRPIRPGDSAPIPTTTSNRKRVSEIGLAEIIDDNDGSNKYLALHRTAPVGSLVQVRNDVNKQVVWVKIIGKLPDTGVNDRIIIKLSPRAFEKLSPHDRRFRAEVIYLAQN
ncbi:hypothetical protein GCM10023189_34200 [Nibrella saemangeumensis]|uniref:LysM domain-containing protein n=1 Tax=Nibrella saemangeumensis TaxID=1084526 RepID=A0ABP8N3Q2_9BACT